MSRLLKPLLLTITALLPTARFLRRPEESVEGRSDHFEIYTTDNEATAKAAIEHFETARAYLMARFSTDDPFETPVRIQVQVSRGFQLQPSEGRRRRARVFQSKRRRRFHPDGRDREGILRIRHEGIRGHLSGAQFSADAFLAEARLRPVLSTLQTGEGTVKVGEAPHLAYRAGSAPTLSGSAMALVIGRAPGDVEGQESRLTPSPPATTTKRCRRARREWIPSPTASRKTTRP